MYFNNLISATKRKLSPLILSVPVAALMMTVFTPSAQAASIDDQINQLKQNSAQAAQNKQQLGAEANNLAGTIAALQAEIAVLDKQVAGTEQKIASLKNDIAAAEAELAHQRSLLGINMKVMYTGQDISTLEMLASSKNLSHFMDREEYHADVQAKIDSATKRIEKLSAQLNAEKQSVENMLSDQKAMQSNLAARRAENSRLLSLNQEQQQAFQNSLNASSAQIAELQKQQAAENKKGLVSPPSTKNVSSVVSKPAQNQAAAPKAPVGTAYPWANVPFPNSMPDPWGMYKRQCVSYTAWKVANSGRHMPYWGGRGNAKLWDDNARRAGIPVDNNPRVGDVAVSNAGTYGHVMYVEAVHGDGTITVSQYNADWKGNYSEARRKAANLAFVHF